MTRSPMPIDRHVGRRLGLARVGAGMSQPALALALGGISFQQLQKYESGQNRISASRLWLAAKTLDRPIGWFFEGFEEAAARQAANDISRSEEGAAA